MITLKVINSDKYYHYKYKLYALKRIY